MRRRRQYVRQQLCGGVRRRGHRLRRRVPMPRYERVSAHVRRGLGNSLTPTIHAYITPLTDQHSYIIDDFTTTSHFILTTFTTLRFTSKGRRCRRVSPSASLVMLASTTIASLVMLKCARTRSSPSCPRPRPRHAKFAYAHAHAHARRPNWSAGPRRIPPSRAATCRNWQLAATLTLTLTILMMKKIRAML